MSDDASQPVAADEVETPTLDQDGKPAFFGINPRDGVDEAKDGAGIVHNTQINTLLQNFEPGSVPMAELAFLDHQSPELADRVMKMVERADLGRERILKYNIGAAERAQAHDYRMDWFIAPAAWLFAVFLAVGGMFLIMKNHGAWAGVMWTTDFLYVMTMRRRTTHDNMTEARARTMDAEADQAPATTDA